MENEKFLKEYSEVEQQIREKMNEVRAVKSEWSKEVSLSTKLKDFDNNQNNIFDMLGKKYGKKLYEKEKELSALYEREYELLDDGHLEDDDDDDQDKN